MQTLHFKWILWLAGLTSAGYVLHCCKVKKPFFPDTPPSRFLPIFLIIGMGLITAAAQLTQFYALKLPVFDFWLFQDMLDHLGHGQAWLTRYAPQTHGLLQHGAIHTFFTQWLWAPFVYVFGATSIALLQGSISITCAAWVLYSGTRRTTGEWQALCISLSFFVCTPVASALRFDWAHPELMIPFFAFLFLFLHQQQKTLLACVALGLCALIKEDSTLMLLPLLLALALRETRPYKKTIIYLVVVIASTFLHWLTLKHLQQNAPSVAPGPIAQLLSAHPELQLHNPAHWGQLVLMMLQKFGGISEFFTQTWQFFINRHFLNLILLAPWVLLSGGFWLAILPLSCVYTLIGGQLSLLVNYYIFAFLPAFWWFSISSIQTQPHQKIKNAQVAWLLTASLFIGATSIEFALPIPQATAARTSFHAVEHELELGLARETLPSHSLWVHEPILPLMTSRTRSASVYGAILLPAGGFQHLSQIPATVNGILLAPALDAQNLPQQQTLALEQLLARAPEHWQRITPVESSVQFFKKRATAP